MKKEILVVYVGRRMGSSKRLLHAFAELKKGVPEKDPEKIMLFSQVKNVYIGKVYKVEVDGKSRTIKTNPDIEDVDFRDEDLIDVWNAHDMSSSMEYRRHRANEKAKNNPELFRDLGRVKRAYQKLGYMERQGFLDALANFLHKKDK